MDVTPASEPNEVQLPYPMQIGPGSWEVTPGLTFLTQGNKASLGAQALFRMRIGDNDRDYQLGNVLDLNLWGAYRLTDWASVSIRMQGRFVGEIDGADPAYSGMVNMRMVPTVFAENLTILILRDTPQEGL